MDGIQLPNQNTIKSLDENESYKYLGILEADNIKQAERKGKVKKEYLRRTRKRLETKQQKSDQRNEYLSHPHYKIL